MSHTSTIDAIAQKPYCAEEGPYVCSMFALQSCEESLIACTVSDAWKSFNNILPS